MRTLLLQLFLASSFCLSVVLLAGCGGSGAESEPVQPAPPPPAKAMLNEVAETGQLGSAAETIRESLTEMKATDPAKADALLRDLDQLEAMKDPNEIKTKAKAMANKL